MTEDLTLPQKMNLTKEGIRILIENGKIEKLWEKSDPLHQAFILEFMKQISNDLEDEK